MSDKSVLNEMNAILDIMATLWNTQQASLLFLMEQLSQSLQLQILPFVNRILFLLADVLSSSSIDSSLANPLRALKILRILSPYLQDWVPVVSQILVHSLNDHKHIKLRKEAIATVGHVCFNIKLGRGVTPLILAVASCLKDEELRSESVDILAILAYQLGVEYITLGHANRINNLLYQYNVSSTAYEKIVAALHDDVLLKQVFSSSNLSSLNKDEVPIPVIVHQPNLTVSQDNIRAAWDFNISGGEKAYQDWFRRLSRVHLRESPSPPLRACYLVAERYQVTLLPQCTVSLCLSVSLSLCLSLCLSLSLSLGGFLYCYYEKEKNK